MGDTSHSPLPGQFNDPIELLLKHVTLVSPDRASLEDGTRISLEELEETLPKGRMISKTFEGRYFFHLQRAALGSWIHPDPDCADRRYKSCANTDSTFEPHYEALSYTWGTSRESETVLVRDTQRHQLHGSLLATTNVTPNLACALRHLRSSEQPQTLWIDALCINQSDDRRKVSKCLACATFTNWPTE